MNSGENRLNPTFLEAMSSCLQRIAGDKNAKALVIASKTKWWSNGVDLDWVSTTSAEAGVSLMRRFGDCCASLMRMDIPVVACLNGHAFGAGFVLAMACDYRVMAPAKGFLCLPAITLGIQLPEPLIHLVRDKIGNNGGHFRDICLQGRRYGGNDAQKMGLVDVVCEDPLSGALELASQLGGNHALRGRI
jgi:Delta3-Delta2-enoyl-CoA isomerase